MDINLSAWKRSSFSVSPLAKCSVSLVVQLSAWMGLVAMTAALLSYSTPEHTGAAVLSFGTGICSANSSFFTWSSHSDNLQTVMITNETLATDFDCDGEPIWISTDLFDGRLALHEGGHVKCSPANGTVEVTFHYDSDIEPTDCEAVVSWDM